jgi:hypothetical protein
MQRRFVVILVLLGFSFTACQPAKNQGLASVVQSAPYITPGPLNKTAAFWDLGISVKYPENWVDPQYIAGQMTLAQSLQAAHGKSATEPVIALSIRNNSQLRLSKDASLQDIAAALTAGPGVTFTDKRSTTFAGLDAASINLTDATNQLYGSVLAFRLPDGRLGSLISVAPFDQWAEFAPTLDKMLISAGLLKPADFKLPAPGGSTGVFPAGGIAFSLPQGWVSKQVGTDANTATIYRNSADTDYLDNSGFVNGPQLVIIGRTLAPSQTVRDALTTMITKMPGDQIGDVKVGDQSGTQILSVDPQTGQGIIFVGVASQDKRVLMVFRWTAPGILAQATRPMFDSILSSVRFGPITTSFSLQPAPVGTQSATP